DDHCILRASLALHALAIGSTPAVDVLCYRRRANKGDGAHIRVIEQGIDGLFAAVYQAEHTRGQTQLIDQLKHPAHRHWYLLRRLENETIAAGNGIGHEPQGNHAGKVEWRNCCDNSYWLSQHVFVNASRDIFDVVAHHE